MGVNKKTQMVIALLLILLMSTPTAQAESSGKSKNCSAISGTTLTSNAWARVFRTTKFLDAKEPAGAFGSRPSGFKSGTYACLKKRSGRLLLLGARYIEDDLSTTEIQALKGRYLFYDRGSYGYSGGGTVNLYRLDLGTAKQSHVFHADGATSISSLIATGSGRALLNTCSEESDALSGKTTYSCPHMLYLGTKPDAEELTYLNELVNRDTKVVPENLRLFASAKCKGGLQASWTVEGTKQTSCTV